MINVGPDQTVAAIIGRGHSGTRLAAQTLAASGFYMGDRHNDSDDLIPIEPAYEAARIAGTYVEELGALSWNFDRLFTEPVPDDWTAAMSEYLRSIAESDAPLRAWKLPEMVLSFPFLARSMPDVHYILWVRDPRDCILKKHATDDLARFNVPCSHRPAVLGHPEYGPRIQSWVYQYRIMMETVLRLNRGHAIPTRMATVRFEDMVEQQRYQVSDLGEFLGTPVSTVPVRAKSVGRWKTMGFEGWIGSGPFTPYLRAMWPDRLHP